MSSETASRQMLTYCQVAFGCGPHHTVDDATIVDGSVSFIEKSLLGVGKLVPNLIWSHAPCVG